MFIRLIPMIKQKNSLKVLALFFCMFLHSSSLFAWDDSPPVEQLKELYCSNSEFRINVDNMLANVQPLTDGSENDGIADL